MSKNAIISKGLTTNICSVRFSVFNQLANPSRDSFPILFAECDMAAEEPSVYVQISWDMAWRRFCSFADFFAEKLSGELYETKVLIPYVVQPVRIRFMNYESHCKDKGSNEDAVLDLFVSKSEKDLGPGDVDRNITILAYTKLHDYWRNKKMALLDPIFLGKVVFYGM